MRPRRRARRERQDDSEDSEEGDDRGDDTHERGLGRMAGACGAAETLWEARKWGVGCFDREGREEEEERGGGATRTRRRKRKERREEGCERERGQ